MKCLIKTERLFIRLAEPEDAEDIFSYRSDFAENQFQGWFPDSVEEVRDYISNMPGTMDVANICFQVAIVLVNENRLIGDMGSVLPITIICRQKLDVRCIKITRKKVTPQKH